MGDRSPDLSFPAGGISRRAEAPGHRGEDSDALGHQLEDGADLGADVAVQHRSLITAVASHRHAVFPPAAPIGAAVQPAYRGDVTAARRAAGQEGEIGNAGGRGKAGDGDGPAAVLQHGPEMGEIARGETRFSDIRAQSIDQQQETALHTSSAIAGWLVTPL
jgi:hypothetical protein